MSPVRLLAQEASAEVEFGSGENLALFAIMAIWVAVVEMDDAPSDEVQLISQSEAIDDHGRRGGSD